MKWRDEKGSVKRERTSSQENVESLFVPPPRKHIHESFSYKYAIEYYVEAHIVL